MLAGARGTARRPRARRSRRHQHPTRGARPIVGASACCERQATSRTAGSSAAESSAETGAGASECASGSQLCTGAQPIFAARPASSRTYATTVTSGSSRRVGRERHVERVEPAAAGGRPSIRIPSNATPRPSDVRIKYFQPASSARARPLKPTRSAEAAVVASITSHAAPRFPASGTASRTAQNAKTSPSRCALGPVGWKSDPRRGSRNCGETSALARPTTPITPMSRPPAASTTIQRPTPVPGSTNALPPAPALATL